MLLDVLELSLGVHELLIFEVEDARGAWGSVLRFNGPIELADLRLERKIALFPNGSLIPGEVEEPPFDTHFDLPLNLRIRFSAGYPKKCRLSQVSFLKMLMRMLLTFCLTTRSAR